MLHAAEGPSCLRARFVAGKAALLVLLGEHIEVGLDLLCEAPLAFGMAEETDEAR